MKCHKLLVSFQTHHRPIFHTQSSTLNRLRLPFSSSKIVKSLQNLNRSEVKNKISLSEHQSQVISSGDRKAKKIVDQLKKMQQPPVIEVKHFAESAEEGADHPNNLKNLEAPLTS